MLNSNLKKIFLVLVATFSISLAAENILPDMKLDQFQKILSSQFNLMEDAMNHCIENDYEYFKITEFSFEHDGETVAFKTPSFDENGDIYEKQDLNNSYKVYCYKDEPSDENVVPVKKYRILKTLSEENELDKKEPSENVIHISDAKQFHEEIESCSTDVFIDFYSETCPPCQMLSPLFDRRADDLAGKAKFLKVDVKTMEDLSKSYEIKALPTLVVINKEGDVVAKKIGLPDIAYFLEEKAE